MPILPKKTTTAGSSSSAWTHSSRRMLSRLRPTRAPHQGRMRPPTSLAPLPRPCLSMAWSLFWHRFKLRPPRRQRLRVVYTCERARRPSHHLIFSASMAMLHSSRQRLSQLWLAERTTAQSLFSFHAEKRKTTPRSTSIIKNSVRNRP